MTISQAFASKSSYGVTYASLDESGLRFESEARVCSRFVHGRDGARFCTGLGARREVWSPK